MRIKHAISAAPSFLRACMGQRVPLRVSHCVTYRCNLDCEYCERHRGGREMSTEQVKDLMGSFRRAGCRFWSFNGGEPLMRDDLGDLISHGKALRMVTSVATNGTLAAQRIGDISAADIVSVSVDGLGLAHDSIRTGSFRRVLEGIAAIRSAGPALRFTTVVAAHNIGRLGDVLALAQEHWARVFFQPVRVQKEDLLGNSRRFFPSREEMAEAMDFLIASKDAGMPVASTKAYLAAIRDSWPDRMPPVRCQAGRSFCFITPEGYVTACCDTLARAKETGGSGPEAFFGMPRFECETCYSSLPLESNLLMCGLPGSAIELLRGA
jgi:MoaA/NifB/PqqE/SkfB family radical SAM enzyme